MGVRRASALLLVAAPVVATAGAQPQHTNPPSSLPPPLATMIAPAPIAVAIEAPPDDADDGPQPAPADSPSCPRGMLLVDGDSCAEVEQRCLAWATEEPAGARTRCLRFDEHPRCVGAREHLRFCMDELEYPNRRGALPVVMRSWTQARETCAAAGKRLCTGSEWTLACEGEERLPYPYGFVRDGEACNVDLPMSGPYPRVLEHPPKGVGVSLVDWREPSGVRARCVSPYGVRDMTGNVDEWVVNESGKPFASGLKGGHWGPVRDRCRPMTTAHNEAFAYFEVGFRCCGAAR
jgi:hypothetical protein